MSLKEEVMVEASRRYHKQGYGQSEFYDVAIDLIVKRIKEYRDNYDNYCHDCAKMNINDVIQMITGREVEDRGEEE